MTDLDKYPPHIRELIHTWRAQGRVIKGIGDMLVSAQKSLNVTNKQLWEACQKEGIDMNAIGLTDGIIEKS